MKNHELEDFMDMDDSMQVIMIEKEYPKPRRDKPLTRKKRKELARQISEDLAYFASPEWEERRKKLCSMTIKEIRIFAEVKNISLPKKAKKAELIHIIQRSEGNQECYGTKPCDNTGCLWYQDCIKESAKSRQQ